MAGVLKRTTGFTGLGVAEFPHKALKAYYLRTLRYLKKMPQNAAYRKHTEVIVNERLNHVNTIRNVEKLEKALNAGQIEEVICQAQREAQLAETMLHYKPWEPLIEDAPAGQWKWPI